MSKLPFTGSDPYTYPRHSGVDVLRGPKWLGKPFYASGPGRVVRLSKNAAGGNWIVVKYDAIPYEVGYAHMRSHNGCPRPGTRVSEGTRLGYVGDLGTRVTGPHVHVEILGKATTAAVWQYFDRNRVVGAEPSGSGDNNSENHKPATERKKSMATLYHQIGSKPARYALAGDSPGTEANWLETTDYNGLAVPWARTHGNAITLSAATWQDYRRLYSTPA